MRQVVYIRCAVGSYVLYHPIPDTPHGDRHRLCQVCVPMPVPPGAQTSRRTLLSVFSDLLWKQ